MERQAWWTTRRLLIALLLGGIALLSVIILLTRCTGEPLDAPAAMTCWPWPQATQETPHAGVTHWRDTSSPDGTVLHLFAFDFAANPHLRLELYDQDEDDATPFDNNVTFWQNGVAQVTRHLQEVGRGQVMAAWNGLFFTADADGIPNGLGHHLAQVVLNSQVHYNVGNVRWTVGVRYQPDGPVFATAHLPNRATLAREFSYAAAGAQCLLREGQPLTLAPFPAAGAPLPPQPVPSTPQEAGYIPDIDHLKTSRTSMGWSRDNRQFYLLLVQEPDDEGASIRAFRARTPTSGGWMVADLQRFWQALGVWGAVNVDGGDVTQATFLRADGNYTLLPPRWVTRTRELTCPPTFPTAPAGGTLMYFYVRDTAGK